MIEVNTNKDKRMKYVYHLKQSIGSRTAKPFCESKIFGIYSVWLHILWARRIYSYFVFGTCAIDMFRDVIVYQTILFYSNLRTHWDHRWNHFSLCTRFNRYPFFVLHFFSFFVWHTHNSKMFVGTLLSHVTHKIDATKLCDIRKSHKNRFVCCSCFILLAHSLRIFNPNAHASDNSHFMESKISSSCV